MDRAQAQPEGSMAGPGSLIPASEFRKVLEWVFLWPWGKESAWLWHLG